MLTGFFEAVLSYCVQFVSTLRLRASVVSVKSCYCETCICFDKCVASLLQFVPHVLTFMWRIALLYFEHGLVNILWKLTIQLDMLDDRKARCQWVWIPIRKVLTWRVSFEYITKFAIFCSYKCMKFCRDWAFILSVW